MTAETKIRIRRLALRWLRKLMDLADDRLHAAEVRFRDEQADRVPIPLEVESPRTAGTEGEALPHFDPFPQDELLRHRVRGRASRRGEPQRREKTPRRRMTAAEFDLRYAR